MPRVRLWARRWIVVAMVSTHCQHRRLVIIGHLVFIGVNVKIDRFTVDCSIFTSSCPASYGLLNAIQLANRPAPHLLYHPLSLLSCSKARKATKRDNIISKISPVTWITQEPKNSPSLRRRLCCPLTCACTFVRRLPSLWISLPKFLSASWVSDIFNHILNMVVIERQKEKRMLMLVIGLPA